MPGGSQTGQFIKQEDVPQSMSTAKLAMGEWKEKYCEEMLLDGEKLTLQDKEEMREAWKIYKAA
jgi:hypothetical protein